MSEPFLHVACGTATTCLIEAASIPGRLSIWADPLYEGPVPDVGDRELLRVRARYLSGGMNESDEVLGLQGWRNVISAIESYDELLLWYEHDLFDQLNLLQLHTWIHDSLPPARPVTLVEIGSFPGRSQFMGLGELSPPEIRSLLERRVAVSAARYEVATRGWTAFRHRTPAMLEALIATGLSAMPFLGAALRRFFEEYPWTSDGLSRTERRVLEVASAGPIDLFTGFVRMHLGETAYYVTDLSYLAFLRTFSECDPPLVTVTPLPADANRIPDGTVTITDRGRALLNGEFDWIATYGIDKWLGGVHLTTDGVMWRWDPRDQHIVNP